MRRRSGEWGEMRRKGDAYNVVRGDTCKDRQGEKWGKDD